MQYSSRLFIYKLVETKGENVKNKDLWESLIELRRKINQKDVVVKITKIKGHAGNTFNELVDKLAKEESMKAKEIQGGK